MDLRRTGAVARDVVAVSREHNVTLLAGSIAHAAFLSLLPILLLLFIVVGAVGNEYLTAQVTALARDHLSPAGEGLVFEALTHASGRAGASFIGVVSLLWGMFRIVRGLETAFDELYDAGESSILEKAFDAAIVFGVILLATVGAGLVAAAMAVFDAAVLEAVAPIALFLGLSIAFFPMYYVFPEPNVTAREVLPGTLLAAAGWVALEGLFGVYVALVDTVGTYATLGAVILLLVWLYGNALVLLVGAVVNVVRGGYHRSADDDADDATEPVRV